MSTHSENEPDNRDNIPSNDIPSGDIPTKGHFLELKVPPAVVFVLFSLLFWIINTWFPVFDVDIPFRLALVLFLTGTALLVGLWSIWLFYRNGTTVHAHKPRDTVRLITTGPYKHSRNPMYLSLSMVLIAQAIFLTDLLALMLMPAFFAYMNRFQIMPEERIMHRKFGKRYEDYADKTPRWL
ncbi:MAG: isoprenylcysteine carboxylmethyltransferase family protein [Cyclonatronaceae bacterium]